MKSNHRTGLGYVLALLSAVAFSHPLSAQVMEEIIVIGSHSGYVMEEVLVTVPRPALLTLDELALAAPAPDSLIDVTKSSGLTDAIVFEPEITLSF